MPPSLGSSGEPGHPLYDKGGGGQFVRSTQALVQGSGHMLTEAGDTPTRQTSTEKYTSENIHGSQIVDIAARSTILSHHRNLSFDGDVAQKWTEWFQEFTRIY